MWLVAIMLHHRIPGLSPDALQIYDVASNTWSAGPDLPIPRGGVAGGVVNGKFYVANGADETYEYLLCPRVRPGRQHVERKGASTLAPTFSTLVRVLALPTALYIGGGYFGEDGFFEYDPIANEWAGKGHAARRRGQKIARPGARRWLRGCLSLRWRPG